MKSYFLLSILLIHLNLLSAQTTQHFKLSKPKVVNTDKTIRIGSNNFSFKTDDYLDYLIMECSSFKSEPNDLKVVIDTVDYSPYNSKLYSFISNNKEFVVLWVTEYEYYPLIIAYYLKEGSLSKIGSLEISRPDSLNESFEYPIKCIRVSKLGDNIEFSFLKDVNYKINDNEWKLYKAGLITYRYNIPDKKFEIIQ